ncbi:hypothetical protein SAMN02927900_02894 [Rhizobium mongolense subsp. loessense]|uniref:Uncharacterized protein n=1 Tax=Rhizobium mongolense subsp. loessense TaxID=158890 RepID=A0A1G4RN03_9HYPH|nr:hypothetical protein SAMN02927900_02894 [Rhizobium mongolense subsp. loessense]
MRLMMRDKRRNDGQLGFNPMESFATADDGIGLMPRSNVARMCQPT